MMSSPQASGRSPTDTTGSFSKSKMRVVAGNGNRDLAALVAAELGVQLTKVDVGARTCGEVTIDVAENVRSCDVYIVHSTCGHAGTEINHTVLELLFLIRRLKQEGAHRITAVVPFFAYARQDRKTDLRAPISASAISQLIDRMGVDRVVTLDLHAGQIQGYFNNRAPLDNLQMAHEFAQYVRTCRWFKAEETVIVSPDAGGVARAHAFADILGVSHIVTIMKRRAKAGVVSEMQTVGDVKGYTCIILDDMVDTGGTLVAACNLLRNLGATKVFACITHGILNHPCIDRVNGCEALEELIISDSIPQHTNQFRCPKLRVLTIASLLAQAMVTYNMEKSISELFKRPSTPSPRISQPRGEVSPLTDGEGKHFPLETPPLPPPTNAIPGVPMTASIVSSMNGSATNSAGQSRAGSVAPSPSVGLHGRQAQ